MNRFNTTVAQQMAQAAIVFDKRHAAWARPKDRGSDEGYFGDCTRRSQGFNMRRSSKSIGLFCVVVLTVLASFGRAQTAEAPQRQDPLPAARSSEPPAYPLVIRIDHLALELLATTKVDEWGRVDDVILGTRAVGKSHTQGSISGLMVPDGNDASFDIVFQGRTHTTTVGTNGPALIYSHTDTDFVCTRPITFHAGQGFVAAACTIIAHTTVVYDGFGSSRGRLGHRLISRIASRRAGEAREQVRQIAARINEHALLEGFDKLLNPQLAAMNKKMDLVRYVNRFVGDVPVQFAGKSSKDCIYIGVGHEGSAVRLTAIPPRREAAAPIEIWLHQTILGEPVAKLIHLVENTAWSQPLRSKLLMALAITEVETARIKDIVVCDDWFVLGLQNEAAVSPSTAMTQRSASDSTKSLGASMFLAPRSERP